VAGAMGVYGSTDTTLNHPFGIAIDPQTRSLYIADYDNGWIRMLTQAAMQASLTPTMTFFATHASVLCLWGIAVDSSSNVYFTDTCSSLVFLATRFRRTSSEYAYLKKCV